MIILPTSELGLDLMRKPLSYCPECQIVTHSSKVKHPKYGKLWQPMPPIEGRKTQSWSPNLPLPRFVSFDLGLEVKISRNNGGWGEGARAQGLALPGQPLSPGAKGVRGRISMLKVPKREIFDRSDFSDFYTIKSLWVGDLLVKILTYYFNFWES